MKISTHSQNNNMSFGVRMPLRQVTVADVKKHSKKMHRKLIPCQHIHVLMAEHIEKSPYNLSLFKCFKKIKKCLTSNVDGIMALIKSGQTIEQVFYETCDSLFDVQLTTNDEKDDQTIDNIFEQQKNGAFNLEDRKKIIASCVKYCVCDAMPGSVKTAYDNIVDNKKINCRYSTVKNYKVAIFKIYRFYDEFISQAPNQETSQRTDKKTLKKFQEYVAKKINTPVIE